MSGEENECLIGLAEIRKAFREIQKDITEDKSQLTGEEDTTAKESLKSSIKQKEEELQSFKEKESKLRQEVQLLLADHENEAKSQEEVEEVSSEISFNEIKESTRLHSEEALTSVQTSRFSYKLKTPERFKREDNFTLFCQNFMDYIKLAKIRDENLYLFFLSLVDDFTKEKLKSVALSKEEKKNAELFIAGYEKKMTPQHEVESLRFKLIDSKQSSEESIEDFAFRLKQMSAKAFTAEEEVSRPTSCYSIFL